MVPLELGTVIVRVVEDDIPEHSKASCFVLSELSLTLKPLSLVTTAAEVTDVKPAIVVAEPPKAIEVDPTVTVEFAN